MALGLGVAVSDILTMFSSSWLRAHYAPSIRPIRLPQTVLLLQGRVGSWQWKSRLLGATFKQAGIEASEIMPLLKEQDYSRRKARITHYLGNTRW